MTWISVATGGQPPNSSNRPTTTYESNPKPQSQAKSSTLHMGEVESSNRMLPSQMHKIWYSRASFSVSFHQLDSGFGSSIELMGSTEHPSLRLRPLPQT